MAGDLRLAIALGYILLPERPPVAGGVWIDGRILRYDPDLSPERRRGAIEAEIVRRRTS